MSPANGRKLEVLNSAQSELTDFERIEDKFVLPKNLTREIVELVSHHLEPCYVDENTKFTLVESIYFDSPNLDFLAHHINELDPRYKIRIRRYAPNGQFRNDTIFLEYKKKSQGVTSKRRFKLDPAQFSRMLKGEALNITAGLMNANPNMEIEKLQKRVQRVNELIAKFCLQPQIRVVYQRLAFERNDLRITVDSNVRYECLGALKTSLDSVPEEKARDFQAGRTPFSNSDDVIVEVKHQGPIPNWLEYFVQSVQATDAKFSKYCWSVFEMMGQNNPEYATHLGGK